MMTMQILSTCVEKDISAVYLVSNNAGLGMVRDNLGEKRIAVDFPDTDFAKIAEGMGAVGLRVSHAEELAPALAEAQRLNKAGKTVLIDVLANVEDRRARF